MSLPLYRELQDCAVLDQLRDKQHSDGHAGLWFERFYNRYPHDYTDTKGAENDFLAWLDEFKTSAGDQDLLDQALARQFDLVGQLNGQCGIFKSPWHYVSGMGYPHPLENGFNWHPVLGVPYLPGSGLKGLVRSWVEAWAFDSENQQEQQAKKARLLDWFGSEEKGEVDTGNQHTGKVIFFDTLPRFTVKLMPDVMTPHMGDWYARGGEIKQAHKEPDKVPADWHSPKPIYFLSAVEPVFLVSVAPRNAVVAQEVNMAEVMQCVRDAFEWLGAGAKTAVGYGQFEQDEALTAEFIEEQQQRAQYEQEQKKQAEALSGVALTLMQYSQKANWKNDKNAFLLQGDNSLENWLEKLADEPDPAAIRHLRSLFEKHFPKPDLLSNPEATSGKKNKPVFKARAQALAKQFLLIESGLKE